MQNLYCTVRLVHSNLRYDISTTLTLLNVRPCLTTYQTNRRELKRERVELFSRSYRCLTMQSNTVLEFEVLRQVQSVKTRNDSFKNQNYPHLQDLREQLIHNGVCNLRPSLSTYKHNLQRYNQ